MPEWELEMMRLSYSQDKRRFNCGAYGTREFRRDISDRNTVQSLRRLPRHMLRAFQCATVVAAMSSLFTLAAHSEPLRVRGAQFCGDLPTLIADTERFFETNGLEIQVSSGHDGKVNMASLRRGEIDYALMTMTPFVLDRMRDPTPGEEGDPVILANLNHGTSNLRIIVRPEDGEPESLNAKSLEGKRIGLSRGTNAEYLWSLFATFYNIDVSKVDLIDVASERIGDALVAGQIDAAVIWAPWLHDIRDRLDYRLTVFEEEMRFLYASRWILVTTEGTAPDWEKRHEAVLRGYVDAIKWIQLNRELAAERYRDAWRVGNQQTETLGVKDAIFDVTLDWSLYASYHQQLEWARRAGYPDSGGTGDFLTAVESGPLRSLSPSSVLLSDR